MRYILSFLLSISFLLDSAYAGERKMLYEGFDAQIFSYVDDMTDVKSGSIYLNFGPIYMLILGHNNYVLGANDNDLIFAFDAKHLIRVGGKKPLYLKYISRGNFLKPSNAAEAELVIKSFTKGEEIKIRYYNWPEYSMFDIKLQNPMGGFIYGKAAKLLGWKDLGLGASLEKAPAKLDIYNPTDAEQKGYASVTVKGNSDLGLKKTFYILGGEATITIGANEVFGLSLGRWICKSVEPSGDKYLIILDLNENIVFKELLPSVDWSWPIGEAAAKKAWEYAPFGSIEIEGSDPKKVSLYGFRELWKWGVDNAGFPSLHLNN